MIENLDQNQIIFIVTIGVFPEPIIQFTEFATPAINAGFMP